MALNEDQKKDLEKLSQTNDNTPNPMTAIFDQHPSFVNNTKLLGEGAAARLLFKYPGLGNFLGSSVLGIEGATAISDRLGYTSNLSGKISEKEPTVGGIYAKDALKYANIVGSGLKNLKQSGKEFEALRGSEAYIEELAQQERMNRMMSMWNRTSYSNVPLSKLDLLKNEGIEISKKNAEKVAKIKTGTYKTINATADLAQKMTGDIPHTEEVVSKVAQGAKVGGKFSPILGALFKRAPYISAAWDAANAGVYGLQGDYGNTMLKGLEVADQAAWFAGPEAGLLTIPLNFYLDSVIAERHKKFLGKQEGMGKNKKGITINPDGSANIPKNADKLTQDEALKYAIKGRQIHRDDQNNWYLVDKDNDIATKKIDMSISAPISPESRFAQEPPQVTLDLSNYASPKETSPEGLFAAPTPTPTPKPTPSPTPASAVVVPPTPPIPKLSPAPTPASIPSIPNLSPAPTPASIPSISEIKPIPAPTPSVKPLPSPTPFTPPTPPITTPSVLKQPATIQSTVEVPSPVLQQQQQDNKTHALLQGIKESVDNNGVGKGDVNIVGGGSSSNQTTIISTGYRPLKEYRRSIKPAF
jgi:hypothetical protein